MRKADLDTRIAVTGTGIICSIGRNKDEVWQSIVDARAGIAPLAAFPGETFPTDLAAEAAMTLPVTRKEAKRLSRSDLLALAAAREAVAQASSSATLPMERAIVSTGTSTGGLLEGEA